MSGLAATAIADSPTEAASIAPAMPMGARPAVRRVSSHGEKHACAAASPLLLMLQLPPTADNHPSELLPWCSADQAVSANGCGWSCS